MDSSQAAEMRRAMARNFRELGASQHDVDDLQETLLLRSGKLAARTYKAGSLMAMWMTDTGLVQFYDDQGEMLRTLQITQQPIEQRRAA